MTYILILLCAITTTICIKLKFNTLAKTITIMYSLFTFGCLTLSSINLMGMNNVSNLVYLMWIINILVFISTIILLSKANEKKLEFSKDLEIIGEKILKSKLLKIVSAVLMIILLYYTIKYFHVIKNLDPNFIRIARFTMLFDAPIETLFYIYVVSCISRFNIGILAILVVNNKVFTKQGVMSIINLLLFFMVGFGRGIIYDFLVLLVFSFTIKNINVKGFLNKKNIIKMVCIILIIFFVATMGVLARLNIKGKNIIETVGSNIKEQIIQTTTYFTGSFRMLDIFINEGFSEIEGYTYGRSTFAGADEIIGLFARGVGFNYEILNREINISTQKAIMIGPKIAFNAFYSCVMNYYMDLGILGLLIFPIIHALGLFFVLNNFIKRRDIWSVLLLLLMLNNLFNSVFVWEYQSGEKTFIIVIVIFINLINKKNNKLIEGSNII